MVFRTALFMQLSSVQILSRLAVETPSMRNKFLPFEAFRGTNFLGGVSSSGDGQKLVN